MKSPTVVPLITAPTIVTSLLATIASSEQPTIVTVASDIFISPGTIILLVVVPSPDAIGMSATFMPKPIMGEAGNGMHVHMLLLKDGQPVFSDDNGYSNLSKEAHYFMGGLLSISHRFAHLQIQL